MKRGEWFFLGIFVVLPKSAGCGIYITGKILDTRRVLRLILICRAKATIHDTGLGRSYHSAPMAGIGGSAGSIEAVDCLVQHLVNTMRVRFYILLSGL